MNVQVINYDKECKEGNYTYTTFSKPRALDEFSLNIIDLGNEEIWISKEKSYEIQIINDLKSLETLIRTTKAKVLVSFPQDIYYHLATVKVAGMTQYKYERIKDVLPQIEQYILSVLLPNCIHPSLIYENTTSRIAEYDFNAAFTINRSMEVLVRSNYGKKATLVSLSDKVYLTTLDFITQKHLLDCLVNNIFSDEEKTERPDWMDSVVFGDDDEQKDNIRQGEILIKEGNEVINKAKEKLKENERYKSILYSNGDELVSVVFSILEQLLSYDLSQFKDEKKEDFLVKKEAYTLIGEIKGVSSNVTNQIISQLEVHYMGYQDRLQESGLEENVRQILIVNPFRNKPISERESVHETQINLAKRNKSLIVETNTLLRLYEKFVRGEISGSDCEKLFIEKIGILNLDEIDQ